VARVKGGRGGRFVEEEEVNVIPPPPVEEVVEGLGRF